jgi:hypothetical protein
MLGVPPTEVAARHGISIDIIERQFAPYIGERDLTVPNWNPEFTATADVAPGSIVRAEPVERAPRIKTQI